MPIASFKPTNGLKTTKTQVLAVEPPQYKSIIADNKREPVNSLLSYVSGFPWTVNYYSQVQTLHTDLRELDVSQQTVYQQYTKITGLELRVSSPIKLNQDPDTATVQVTGDAIIYPFLVPNVGDMFVANIGSNLDGLFRITNVTRNSSNRDSVHTVDYDLMYYVSGVENEEFRNIESKVTKILYFDKDRLMEGLNPNLSTEEYESSNQLFQIYQEMIYFYFKSFYSQEVRTLLLPDQDRNIYDSRLVNYLLKTVSTSDAEEIRKIKTLNTDDDPYLSLPCIWDAFLRREERLLRDSVSKFGLARTGQFLDNPFLRNIQSSKIDYMVYPVTDSETALSRDVRDLRVGEEKIKPTHSSFTSLFNVNNNTLMVGNSLLPVLPMYPNDSGTYVFTPEFYRSGVVSSVLENMVLDYIKRKCLDVLVLVKISSQYRSWDRIKQFYYIPFTLGMIRDVVGFSS